jgi:hypothetical protein
LLAVFIEASSAQRTVVYGDAMLPQQEKNKRQMSRRAEYAAMYLQKIGDLAVPRCRQLSQLLQQKMNTRQISRRTE